jgi:NAD(P)-dependent dehydrogenase (short-subunit alcohol dehydrogenase family)
MGFASDLMDLTGATVMVTGASSGIGRETAILLSGLNARVVLVGRNRERLEQTLARLFGQGHRIEPFDIDRSEDIPQWVRGIAAETGPLKVLVHSAGRQVISPLRFVTHKAADGLLRTNLHSAIMLARGFSQKGCYTTDSSIVFLSSVMGLSGKPSMAVYGASKAALIGLAKSLAVELAPDRIRVNCVAPACVRTEMLDEMSAFFSTEQFEALEKAHPLGFGTARDVANAIAFLVADTGRWITGTTLVVDGGYSAQ